MGSEMCIRDRYGVPYVMTLSGGYSKDAWNAQYKSIKALIEEEM